MKQAFRNGLWFTAGALLVLVVLELVLRLAPVSSGFRFVGGFGSGRPRTYEPLSRFTYSRDWDFHLARSGQFNSLGYHGLCEFAGPGQHGVFVVGDSFTESIMVEPDVSFASQLQRLRPDLRVCVAGMSGAPASEYLVMLDDLRRRAPASQWLVVVNRTDFAESLTVGDGFTRFAAPGANGAAEFTGKPHQRPRILDFARQSALYRYIHYNLDAKNTFARLRCLAPWACQSGGSAGANSDADESERHAIRLFMSGLARRATESDAQPTLLLNSVTALGAGHDMRDIPFWSHVVAAAAAEGVAVIDLQQVLQPSNCRPNRCFLFRDGHWSAAGHARIAAVLARQLP